MRPWATFLALTVFFAGCTGDPAVSEPDGGTQAGPQEGTSGAGRSRGEPGNETDREPVDLGGANVTWVGKGEVSFDITVTNETRSLYYGWTDASTTFPVSGAAVEFRIKGGACEELAWQGLYYGYSGAFSWCNGARVGNWTVTVSALGSIQGRVCVLAMGHSSDGVC